MYMYIPIVHTCTYIHCKYIYDCRMLFSLSEGDIMITRGEGNRKVMLLRYAMLYKPI